MITPETVDSAKTRARNATATQNNRSDFHQPAIRSVATTEVAQPLTMLTAQAATAVRELGSSVGLRRAIGCGAGGGRM